MQQKRCCIFINKNIESGKSDEAGKVLYGTCCITTIEVALID